MILATFAALVVAGTVACGPGPGPSPPQAAPRGFEGLSADELGDDPQLLIRVLRSPDSPPPLRMEAAARLGETGAREAVPALAAALDRDLDERTGLWSAVIPALGQLGDARALPVLIRALELRDDDWLGRGMAAAALGELGQAEAVPSLIRAGHFGDTREAAVRSLATLRDPRAAPLMVAALAPGTDPETTEVARSALRDMGKEAVPSLVAALREPPEAGDEPAVSCAALLGEVGGVDASRALRDALRDPRPEVRHAAAAGLARIGGREGAGSDTATGIN